MISCSCFSKNSCDKQLQFFYIQCNLFTNILLCLSNLFSILKDLEFLLAEIHGSSFAWKKLPLNLLSDSVTSLNLPLGQGLNPSFSLLSLSSFLRFDLRSEEENNAGRSSRSGGIIRVYSTWVGLLEGGGAMEKKGTILLQRYELGRLLGQGTFAKVYQARNLKSGQTVAIKMINKEKVLRIGMIDQIKREISVMRRVRHPNVVELYEVMASKTKIYFVMEYVKGGELFSKVAKGKLKEDVARKYFQQLIAAISFCHSQGVYHRDLKPENLLLDENGNLKVSDFGLSALWESRRQDGLLHTTCGTPAYVAPEVISKRGYDGAKADLWSCGVVLFVLLAGYLPFHNASLTEMYRKIRKGEFRCPLWFPTDVRKLLMRILDPNPNTRITADKLMQNQWFKKGLKPVENIESEQEETVDNSGDIQAALVSSTEGNPEKKIADTISMKPTFLNAFDIISLSPGFNLSGLFEEDSDQKAEVGFTTTQPASTIVSQLEKIAQMERFAVKKKDGLVTLHVKKAERVSSP